MSIGLGLKVVASSNIGLNRKKLATTSVIKLEFPGAPTEKKEADETASDPMIALAEYASQRAVEAYDWITNVAIPYVADMDEQLKKSKAIRFAPTTDGLQTRQDRRDDYETTAQNLLAFGPDNDGDFRAEFERSPRFIEDLCRVVRCGAHLAFLASDFRKAETKKAIEELLEEAKDSADDNATKVFTMVNGKGVIKGLRRRYDFMNDAFGDLQDFACGELTKLINDCIRAIDKEGRKETAEQMKQISAPVVADTKVSMDELLFGKPKEVNGKTAVFQWQYRKYTNVIVLSRNGDDLLLKEAVGEFVKADLEEMRNIWDKPFVSLECILAEDGEHLCPEIQGKYKFGAPCNSDAFNMTRWVRTAAGYNLPKRLLDCDDANQQKNAPAIPVISNNHANSNGKVVAKKWLVKPAGELLTDVEFISGGLGEYDLNLDAGFYFQRYDEHKQPVGPRLELTSPAIARLERKMAGEDKTKIVILSVSSEELGALLKAGDAEVDQIEVDGAIETHEYLEGINGDNLPRSLKNGIRVMHAKMFTTEAKAS